MRTFQIDPGLQHPTEADPIQDLCWQATEILGAYMEEACDFDDDMPAGEEWDHDPDEGLSIHETTEITLNRRQFVTLSNMPYIFGKEDFIPVTDPGYVALRGAPFPSQSHTLPFGKSPLDDQLIFRVPTLGTQAVIYHGWEMNPRVEVRREHTQQLRHIGTLLRFVQQGLRTLMQEDMETYEARYLSQVPRRAGGDEVSAFLGSLFGEEE